MTTRNRRKGRPPEIIPPIPDSFENVMKAVLRPVRDPRSDCKVVDRPQDSD